MGEGKKQNRADANDPLHLKHKKKRLQDLKIRRSYKKKQILVSRVSDSAKFAMTVFICWVLFTIVNLPAWYLSPKIFASYPNNALLIEGNEIVKNPQILTALKTVKLPKQPIYLINTSALEKSLSKLAPVKKVYIRRFWFPARIKIVIEEKTPVLSIAPKPTVTPIAVFNDDASIIGSEFLPLTSKHKTYLVLTYGDFSKWSSKHVKYLTHLVKTVESYSGEPLSYIDLRNPEDVYIQLKTVRIRLGDFNTTVFSRLKRISSVLPQTSKLKDKINYIDLRWDNSTFIKLKSSNS